MSSKPNGSTLIHEANGVGVSSSMETAAYVQEKHGAEVKPSLVNNVKHAYAKQAATTKRGRPKKEAAVPSVPAA